MLAELKAATAKKESENRLLMAEVQGLRELVPKSLEHWKKGEEGRLEEVASEVAGLKRLLENRVGRSSAQGTGHLASNAKTATPSPSNAGPQQAGGGYGQQAKGSGRGNEAAADSPLSAGNKESSPQRRTGAAANGGRAAIPAWQMAAAANKSNGGSGSASGSGASANGESAAESGA